MDHILSVVLFTPLAGLLVLLFIPSSNARAIKLWANFAALAGFLVSLPLALRFDSAKDFQFVEMAPWIPSLGATYRIGIDGLGLLLVMLTTLIGFIAILSSWNAVQNRLKETNLNIQWSLGVQLRHHPNQLLVPEWRNHPRSTQRRLPRAHRIRERMVQRHRQRDFAISGHRRQPSV